MQLCHPALAKKNMMKVCCANFNAPERGKRRQRERARKGGRSAVGIGEGKREREREGGSSSGLSEEHVPAPHNISPLPMRSTHCCFLHHSRYVPSAKGGPR